MLNRLYVTNISPSILIYKTHLVSLFSIFFRAIFIYVWIIFILTYLFYLTNATII